MAAKIRRSREVIRYFCWASSSFIRWAAAPVSPGWAEKADSAEHTGQYAGRSGTIPYGAIASVTGATTTSRAMTDGVNQALRVIAETDLEGGGAYGEEGQD